MIYYFSGTGNSLRVARHLAENLEDHLSPMTSASFIDDETIGLVFPVYAWSIPNVVEEFARNIQVSEGRYLYAVMTCGDDVGYADKVLESVLGRKLNAAFSVQMPNTYVCLPGFDIDSSELCAKKLSAEPDAVRRISQSIKAKESVRSLCRGGLPWTKTYIIRPVFNCFLLTDMYFYVDSSRCTSCRKCQKVCPVRNVKLSENRPQWQSRCSGCLACYHACPHHAIHFGSMTCKKGQYTLPQP